MLRFISVLLFSLLSLAAQTPDYFPLVPGSQWLYRAASTGESFTIKIGGERRVEGRTYTEVSGYAPQTLLVRQSEPGIYLYWDSAVQKDALLLNFDGTEYATPATECRQQGKASGKLVEYKGPLGYFDNAKEVRFFGGQCADTGVTRELYLPYAGLFQRNVTTIAGERSFDLVYAQIGGVTYLSDAQISFGVALTPLQQTKDNLQFGVRLTLTNRSGADVVLDFPSSQRYDLRLLDAKGETIYTWSSTRLFLQVLGQEIVKDERVWAETFNLAPQRPGVYSIEAFLTNSDGKRFRATAGFEIK